LVGGDTILIDASMGRVARVIPKDTPAEIAGPPAAGEGSPEAQPAAIPADEKAVTVIRQAAAPKKKVVGTLAGVSAGP
jgi:hypothetical protein